MPSNKVVRIAAEVKMESLTERHERWWNRKGALMSTVDHPPLGDLWLPLSDGTVATEDMVVTPEIVDADRLAGDVQDGDEPQLDGDLFRTVSPYRRIPWVEAISGATIHATIKGGSMRSKSPNIDIEDWKYKETPESRAWLSLLNTLTELLVERNVKARAVTHTLMRGPSDLAEAIFGPESMCYAMYDKPKELTRFLADVTQVFIHVLKQQESRIPSYEGGHINPFGIWAPGTVVRTQCDASAFLSPEQYKRWYLPHDVRICEASDYSIIHLHSCSLHTVDVLLEVERPHAIQITLEDESSAPPVMDLIPVFKKILGRKPLLLEGLLTDEQTNRLRNELPDDGLCINARKSG